MHNPDNNEVPADEQRRSLIRQAFQFSLLSMGAGLLEACGGASGHLRIDVHAHHVPDFYRVSLHDHGILSSGDIPIPPWSPAMAVDFMNKHGIQAQVLSIAEPGVLYLPTPDQRMAMARQINDYTTNELILANHKAISGRFGGFAILPLGNPQDPQDMLNTSAEATRALTQLKMDGIGLYSHYNGVYLGDPSLDPLMATLNTLGAVVFLHPVTPSVYPQLPLPTFLFEHAFDTTRAVVNMLYRGVFQRYPRIRWLLADAGGTLPYLAYRTSLLTLHFSADQNVGLIARQNNAYASLYYDTAKSSAPSAMNSLRTVTDSGDILLGTDWPFSAPLFSASGDPAPALDTTFNQSERTGVDRNNALALLATLKSKIGA